MTLLEMLSEVTPVLPTYLQYFEVAAAAAEAYFAGGLTEPRRGQDRKRAPGILAPA